MCLMNIHKLSDWLIGVSMGAVYNDHTTGYNTKDEDLSPAESPIGPVLTVQLDNCYIFFL